MSVLDARALTFDELIGREWLVTNGAGGYASSTVIGLNTRKYHGLLVAAARPPVGRQVILARVEETISVGRRALQLATVEYPGVIHPAGHSMLRAFDALPHPWWLYQGDGWTLEKSLRFSPGGPNDLIITYTLLGGGGAEPAVELAVKPLFALRGIHELSFQWSGRLEVQVRDGSAGREIVIPATSRTPAAYLVHDGAFAAQADWYLSTIYRRERERGYSGLEDLWTPGAVTFRLSPGRTAHIGVSTAPLELSQALEEIRREDERRVAAVKTKNKVNVDPGLKPPACDLDSISNLLAQAAERFFVWTSPTDAGAWTCVIPQFPWTPLSVRDMLIAFPGLLLVHGRHASARTLLCKLAEQLRDGLLPSELSETADAGPAYNACDVSLWFVDCAWRYFLQTQDVETARKLLPAIRQIIDAYRAGTKLGIGVDSDALLRVREPGIGTTWMNAKVGQWVITPRHGRPVEVNALWYNALCAAAELSQRAGDDPAAAAGYRAAAGKHREAFNRRFWNAAGKSCFDVVYDTGGEAAIRPNQLLAVSLPFAVLNEDRWKPLLATIHDKLLTPFGLRTLASDDSAYQGRYAGDVVERDRAYHNGSVYPWLLGPYATAVSRAFGRTPAIGDEIRACLRGCINHLQGDGLGLIPELFDGDPPHRAGGAIADVRSVGEIARVWAEEIVAADSSRLPNEKRKPQLA